MSFSLVRPFLAILTSLLLGLGSAVPAGAEGLNGGAATSASPVARTTTAPTVIPKTKVTISKSAENKIRAALKAYGVKAKVRDSLIKKLKAGKRWDALIKGKAAKSKTSYRSGAYKFVKWAYPDGSLWVFRVTDQHYHSPNTKSTGSYSDCASYTADHYHVSGVGCDAYGSVIGLYWMSFTFDYAAAPDYREITRTYNLTGGGIMNPQDRHFEAQSAWDVRAYGNPTYSYEWFSLTASVYFGVRVAKTGGFDGYHS